MVARIRSWMFPSFADEDLNRRAVLLSLMGWLSLVLSLVVNGALIVTTLHAGQRESLVIAVATLFASLAWIGVIFFLSRRGWVAAGSHVLLWGGMVIAVASNLVDPASRFNDPVWYLFTVIVIAGTLLLGARWGVILAVVGTLTYTAIALAESAGYVYRVSPQPPPNVPYGVVMTGGSLLALAALAWLFGSGLERALRQARQRADELEEAKERLESTQAYLEQTVERTVVEYSTFARQVAEGDLICRLTPPVSEENPLAVLGENLNTMVEGLRGISRQVYEAVEQITSGAAQILAVTTQQSAGATSQAAAITQASATIEEVRAIAEQTAARAKGVAVLAQKTEAVSRAGQQAVVDTVEGMGQITERVESIAANILGLSEQTQTIESIIALVNDLAKRSNLLALNAAVEAERAGEAGRGFGVVAGEVRSLAEQSRAATVRVQEILGEIQRGVATAVMTTEEGVKRADAGVRLVGEAGDSIRRLAENVGESMELAVQIAAAAEQQLAGMGQITLAMQNIRQTMEQTVAGARQVEQAAAELDALAGRLRKVVGQYRV